MVFRVSRVHIQSVLCNIYLTFWSFNVQFSFCLLYIFPCSFELLNSLLFYWHLICALLFFPWISCLFFFLKIILCIWVFGLPCMFLHHTCACYPWRPELGIKLPGTRVAGVCELLCGCWELTWVLFQEQPLLLSTGCLFSPASFLYMCCFLLHRQAPCYLVLLSIFHIWSRCFWKNVNRLIKRLIWRCFFILKSLGLVAYHTK